jgi:hypothetical protein
VARSWPAFFTYVLLNRARNFLRVADARRKGSVRLPRRAAHHGGGLKLRLIGAGLGRVCSLDGLVGACHGLIEFVLSFELVFDGQFILARSTQSALLDLTIGTGAAKYAGCGE